MSVDYNDVRRYRRLRAALRKTWLEREPYALDARTEDALVKLLVKTEIDGMHHGKHWKDARNRRFGV